MMNMCDTIEYKRKRAELDNIVEGYWLRSGRTIEIWFLCDIDSDPTVPEKFISQVRNASIVIKLLSVTVLPFFALSRYFMFETLYVNTDRTAFHIIVMLAIVVLFYSIYFIVNNFAFTFSKDFNKQSCYCDVRLGYRLFEKPLYLYFWLVDILLYICAFIVLNYISFSIKQIAIGITIAILVFGLGVVLGIIMGWCLSDFIENSLIRILKQGTADGDITDALHNIL